MNTLQSRLRRAIMPENFANIYDSHEERPGCTVQPFCGICKGCGRDQSLFCSKCSFWAFNRHWQRKIAREARALGVIGNDHLPSDFRHPHGEATRALVFLHKAVADVEEM